MTKNQKVTLLTPGGEEKVVVTEVPSNQTAKQTAEGIAALLNMDLVSYSGTDDDYTEYSVEDEQEPLPLS